MVKNTAVGAKKEEPKIVFKDTEHETYVVLDEQGKLVVDDVFHGFDETVKAQVKAEIAEKSGRAAPQMAAEEDLERRRKQNKRKMLALFGGYILEWLPKVKMRTAIQRGTLPY